MEAGLARLSPEHLATYLERVFETALSIPLAVGTGPLSVVHERMEQLGSGVLAKVSVYHALRGEAEASRALLREVRTGSEFEAANAVLCLTLGQLDEARGFARRAVELTRAKNGRKLKGLQRRSSRITRRRRASSLRSGWCGPSTCAPRGRSRSPRACRPAPPRATRVDVRSASSASTSA